MRNKSDLALAFIAGILFIIAAALVVIIAVLAHEFSTAFSLVVLAIVMGIVLSYTKPMQKIFKFLGM